MKFRFYDILSHLIPGLLIYSAYMDVNDKAFNTSYIIPATAIAFIIGYFVNTLASWLEDFFYWTWGGKPSNRLLNGKGIWKVKFSEHRKVKALLAEEYSGSEPTSNNLFGVAMRYATPDVNSRVSDFNTNYAFSRVLLTTILVISGYLIYSHYDSYEVYLISSVLILVSWYRTKQRGYYYAKEVLNTYLKSKSNFPST